MDCGVEAHGSITGQSSVGAHGSATGQSSVGAHGSCHWFAFDMPQFQQLKDQRVMVFIMFRQLRLHRSSPSVTVWRDLFWRAELPRPSQGRADLGTHRAW